VNVINALFSYTTAVMEESLRLSKTGPYAARISEKEDITVGGHVVPKNTPIFIALGVALEDEQAFPEQEK